MKYNLAIVGFGGMGSYHFSSIREQLPEINVVGAYDIREERRNAAKEQGLKAYGSLEELEQDETIDIVLVATPNNFHKDLSIRMLRSGKNVVCEKPVTMNAAELEEIIAVMTETGKQFSVHQNRRWDKDFVIMKKIVDESLLGRPYVIESRVQGSKRVLAGWRGYKINGGGMVLDWGIHLLDQIMWMIKAPVVEVHADLFQLYSTEVDDNCRLLVNFENGVSALIEVSTNCFINQARWHMQCSDGTVVINGWDCSGKMVKLADDRELGWTDEIVYTEAGPTRTMAPRPRETTSELPLPEVETHWSDFYRNFIAVIEHRAEPAVKVSESLRVMKVIDLLFQSAREGHSIRCNL